MNRRLEFWLAANGSPGVTAEAAARAEAEGWDGLTVPDSQNLSGDPYVALAMAARQTKSLLLATGVTNPITRVAAVTATSIASINEESGGRAVLGIGRGDSSLAYLGLAPAPLAVFERYLDRVQGYLKCEEVPFDLDLDALGQAESANSLRLASAPRSSQLRWLRHSALQKVPVEVVASGPKVIASAAVRVERITLAVGAHPQRIEWGVEIARHAREDAGLDPDTLTIGAMVPIMAHEDRKRARSKMAESVPGFIRFSVMHGQVIGPASQGTRVALLELHKHYDMNQHARHGRQSELVGDELLDAFTISGPPRECAERLHELKRIGVDVFHLQGAFFAPVSDAEDDSWSLLAREVLPKLRELASSERDSR